MPKLGIDQEQLKAIQALISPFELIPHKCFLSTDTDRLFIQIRSINKEQSLTVTAILLNEKNDISDNILDSKYTKVLIKAATPFEALPDYVTSKIEFESEVPMSLCLKLVCEEIASNIKQTHIAYIEKLKEKNEVWVKSVEEFFSEAGFLVFHELHNIYEKGTNPEMPRHGIKNENFLFEVDTLLGDAQYRVSAYDLNSEAVVPFGFPIFRKTLPLNTSVHQMKEFLQYCVYETCP